MVSRGCVTCHIHVYFEMLSDSGGVNEKAFESHQTRERERDGG